MSIHQVLQVAARSFTCTAMSAKRNRLELGSPLGRILRNAAWLLGSRGFGAACGLASIVILTRTLGLRGFGHFSLIFGTAQVLVAIAGFQTWRIMVRYGSEHAQAREWDKFGRLGMLCGLLDAAGGLIGCLFAAVLIYGFAHSLDLNRDYIDVAFWFCCASLWALVSAPIGIVRALHRFDMAVYVEAVVPIGRLIAAVAIWQAGPSVGRFLFAWAAIDVLEAVLCWAVARRLCPQAVRLSNLRHWRLALEENPGLARFFMTTHLGVTIDAAMKSGPLLVVGSWLGTSAAGVYRLVSQLAQAPRELSGMLSRPVHAELARVRSASAAAEFRKLVLYSGVIAGVTGLVGAGIALLFGRQLLVLVGGEAFGGAVSVLVPLAIAVSFDLAGLAFEPVLYSTGRAALSLTARVMAVVALVIGFVLFIPMGLGGAAWAVALASAVCCLATGTMAWYTLHKVEREGIGLFAPEPRSTDA